MKFLVLNEKEAKEIKPQEKYVHFSIYSPNRPCKAIPVSKNDNLMALVYLTFHDVQTEFKDYKCFDINDARKILNIMECYKDKVDLFIVNCEAGISRSAGLVSALSKIYCGNDDVYFKKYLPNSLVYSTILKTYYEEYT